MKAWFLTFGVLGAAGCVSTPKQGPSFATGFDVPEADGILIEWRTCTDQAPCIAGEYQGESYALGFHESPSVLAGKRGGKAWRFDLDPASVFRLGDHAIDLLYTDSGKKTVLTLTWNERDQKPIEAQLIQND